MKQSSRYANKLVRWGILGCGDVCEKKSAPAYQQVNGFRLDAVMARTPGKAKDFAQRHGVPKYYQSTQALIDDPDIDAVYIATPPDSHLALALKAAQAGKICSLEKPMALNSAECEQIQRAFAQAQLPLFVAYYRRCLSGFVELKQHIDEGLIGEVRHLNWLYTRPPSPLDLQGQYNWRTNAQIAPGGYFDDIACHGLDIFTFLLGNIATATGTRTNQQHLYSAYDSLSASMLFDSGVTANCAWNFASWHKQDDVSIEGSRGRMRLSIFSEADAILENDAGQQILPMPKPTPIQLDYVRAMRRHLDGEVAHPAQGESAMHTSWIMDKILGVL